MAALGLRQNNPGNIRISAVPWHGLLPVRPGDAYCRFADPEDGLAAIAKNLCAYERLHGLSTVRGWITRFAPRRDHNDTAQYIANVCAVAGVGADQVVSTSNGLFMGKVLRAIVQQENGQQPYTDAQIDRALTLAGIQSTSAPSASSAA